MANFNKKVLCLFQKNYSQLKKEADRRGIPYKTKEETIANIIWKDAYDAGFNEGIIEGKNQATMSINGHLAGLCEKVKPETHEYCLYNMNDVMRYRVELTDDQVNVINWLINMGFLLDAELSEWSNAYEDVGRI